MKRKILFVVLAVVLAAVTAVGTLAYYTDTDSKHNEMTFGSVDIALYEWANKPEGGEPVPFENVIDVQPGMEVPKIAEITNIGNSAVWLRVSVAKAVMLAEGVEETEPINLDYVLIDFDTEHWELHDGFYYYKTPVAPGETTEPLFTKVTFDPEMGNMYQKATAEINVHAYAVQYANNGETCLDAQGWPAVTP